MAIDSYSLCPGGRGKKIQFCCPDHIKDLEQIDKMLEGEQYAAGLSFVESLEKKRPDCACLTEAKCLFQRMIGLWEDAYETAQKFAEREPKNVVALTEAATTAALLDKPQEAVSKLVDALENVEGDQFPMAVVQAMLTVGLSFFENGRLFQAVAIAKQLQTFAPQDPTLNSFLYRCLGSDAVPLMIKEQVFDLEAPADFAKKGEYDSAVSLLAHGQWKRGREILESLLELGEQWPNIFRNLGIVELWFANEEKGRAYLERFLAADGVDYEAKVDVEQFLLLLRTPTWDDVDYMEKRVYTLEDFDPAFEKMLSSRSLVVNPRLQLAKPGDTPPKSAFSLLDRPLCDKTIDLTLEDVSQQIGYLFVYGKTTTRAARAEVYALPADFAAAEATLTSVLGALPACEAQEKIEQQPVMWTTSASTPRFQFRDPAKLTTETIEKLFDDGLKAFANAWYNHPYASLDGKTPCEVLAAEGGKCKIDALIRVVTSLFSPTFSDRVESLLRETAGIAAPGPIAPPENFASAEEATGYFRRVPLWRWGRLQVENCRTDALVELLQIANLVAPREVKEKFAREVIARPQDDVQYEDRSVAYSILVDAAILNRDSDKALELIAEAGAYAKSIGQSDGQWKVLEVMTRFRRQEFDKVRSLARQVFTEYQDDKEAIQALQQFFEEINASAQAQLQAAEAYRLRAGIQPSSPVAPEQPSVGETRMNFGVGDVSPRREQKSSGLWTPGSDNAGGSTGGSKLWTPD